MRPPTAQILNDSANDETEAHKPGLEEFADEVDNDDDEYDAIRASELTRAYVVEDDQDDDEFDVYYDTHLGLACEKIKAEGVTTEKLWRLF
jgi:hypothetical protein